MVIGLRGPLIAVGSIASRVAAAQQGSAIEAAHHAFVRARRGSVSLGPASSLRKMSELGAEPLAQALGYAVRDAQPSSTSSPSASESRLFYALAGAIHVPWCVAPWGARLDSRWRTATIAARGAGSRWAVLFNGTHVRLLDGTSRYAGRWLEIDLDTAADERATFAALWLVARAESVAGELATLVDASDAFAADVCRSLGEGVLLASGQVLDVVIGRRRRPPDVQHAFEQALTVVYRMLFLLFAESRGLVPMWHPLYRRSYSIEALRVAAERGRTDGLWEAVRAVSRLAHAGCQTGPLQVTPFNGRLFDARRTPFVERRDLDRHDDQAASRAVLALTTRVSRERGGREHIAYRDLGVEQLGAVYETLLDYEPRGQDRVRLEPGSGARKASGSFYTPQPMARYLVRHTLAPLVKGRSPQEILALRVLDPSMGSGAFLVAACQFLADAYEEALIVDSACHSQGLDDVERARVRRLVAERCLFGVDLNPMAVQLGRLSLWLATLARDRPLSFLDHHIRSGDSLLGAWVSALDAPPAVLKRAAVEEAPRLFDADVLATTVREWLPTRFALTDPGDTIEQVRGKERMLARLEHDSSTLSRWRRVADLWCACWLSDRATLPASAYRSLSDTLLHGNGPLPPHIAGEYLTRAWALAKKWRFFHWELEFPEVFFDADGRRHPRAGFDAVIGNPPWDMVRGDAGSGATRERARADANRLVRFARDAGAYEASGQGQLNRYQLFVERTVALLRDGGRCGLVLPSGVLSDHSSSPVRRLLLSRCQVDGIVGFDNRKAIFPIHRSVRFVVLTATKGTATQRFGTRLGETDPAVLAADESGSPDWFTVHMSRDLLERLSGSTWTVPDLRSAKDLAIVERAAASFPRLGSRSGWGVQFGRELNATEDRDILRPPGEGLPVVEGKLLSPFAVDVEGTKQSIRGSDAARRLGDRVGRVRLAYRDVAGATNRQTLIAALLPAGCASTHTVFCLKTVVPLWAQYCLCGLFNSYVLNYLVRLRVTTHVTTAIVEQLPVPTRNARPQELQRVAALARRLIRCRNHHTTQAAEWVAALNVAVAAAYRMSVDEYAHVLSSFPLVPAEERTRTLRLYALRPY